MPVLALILGAVYVAVVLGLRVFVQKKRTGSSGLLGLNGKVGSPEWLSSVLLSFSVTLGIGSVVLALSERLQPIEAIDNTAAHTVAIVLFTFGLVATSSAQFAMGSSWRVGVNPSERTELVVEGPFKLVRNPIYTTSLVALLGLALLVGNWVALLAFAVGFTGLEILVRKVEEPYLTAIHKESYLSYATKIGRFLPGIGLLKN